MELSACFRDVVRAVSVRRGLAALGVGVPWMLLSSMAHAGEFDKPGYVLTFHDEFDGTTLSDDDWLRRYKWGQAQINDELQAYTDTQQIVSDGLLHLVGEAKSATYAGKTWDYASGLIASKHHQTYGYFEAKMRLPAGKGLWPAFWLLGENGTKGVNEIDIMEFLGDGKRRIYQTVHWGTSYDEGHESDGTQTDGPDFTADFHVYGLDWEPGVIRWDLDGQEIFRHEGDGVPSVEMYIIANLAIGGSWPGSPDQTTVFPASFDIDYIRAYQRVPDGGADAADGASGAADSASDAFHAAADATDGGDVIAPSDGGPNAVDGRGSVAADARDARANSPEDTGTDVEVTPVATSSNGCGCHLPGAASNDAGILSSLGLGGALAVLARRRRSAVAPSTRR